VIKETKKIHTGWKEWGKLAKLKPEIKISCPFGKYQYLFEKNKKIISMIELPNYMYDGKNRWEIYCMEGNLFDDVISFATEKEARARIEEIFCKDKIKNKLSKTLKAKVKIK
jgi:uncharacterized protein YxjI